MGKVRIIIRSEIPSTIVSNFIFDTGFEYEIINCCGRNIGPDGNSSVPAPYLAVVALFAVQFFVGIVEVLSPRSLLQMAAAPLPFLTHFKVCCNWFPPLKGRVPATVGQQPLSNIPNVLTQILIFVKMKLVLERNLSLD